MSEYSITIKVDSGGGGSGTNTASPQDSSTESQKLAEGSGSLTVKDLKKSVVATGAVAIGTKIINHITSRVYTETGNRQLQDEINAAKQIGGQILALGAGFAAGGIAGAAVVGLGILTDYALQASDYAYSRNLEASVLSIRRERMGVAGMANSRSRSINQ